MVGNPDPGGTLERGRYGVFSRRRRDIRSVPVGPASELRCRGDRVVCLANDTHGLAHGTGRDTREPGDPAAKAACGRWRPDGRPFISLRHGWETTTPAEVFRTSLWIPIAETWEM